MKTALVSTLVLVALTPFASDDVPTSARGKAAVKGYRKAVEKLEAAVERQMTAIQEKYSKALRAALSAAERTDDAAEVERIQALLSSLEVEMDSPVAALRRSATPAVPPGVDEGVYFAGGTGSSLDDAIVIHGAVDSAGAVAAQRAWLTAHRPTWRKMGQALISKELKFDEITLEDSEKKRHVVYFDITRCFGFGEEFDPGDLDDTDL